MKNIKKKKFYRNINLLPIKNDNLTYKKEFIEVYKIQFEQIEEIVKDINHKNWYKFLFNFYEDVYYFFQNSNVNTNEHIIYAEQLDTEEILKLYKSFYTNEEMRKIENIDKVKHTQLKKEIAPYKFKADGTTIETDKGYYSINTIESIISKDFISLKPILEKEDIWLSADFKKLDQLFIINTILKMQQNGQFEKSNINPFIKRNIEKFKDKLNNEEIIQSEFKILVHDKKIDSLKKLNNQLILKLRQKGIRAFEVQENLNILNTFNSCIYPYDRMQIIQSIEIEKFINLLTNNSGGSKYEDSRRTS
ncbi:hypothetical protein [Intestinibacter sp.]|uniref:hypothetical protein n=1 Tax=Intestinibacter sp. TaxID=1965304 RepID=UPI003F183E3D